MNLRPMTYRYLGERLEVLRKAAGRSLLPRSLCKVRMPQLRPQAVRLSLAALSLADGVVVLTRQQE